MYKKENWFQDWFNSPYYHKLYADRDEREAGDFIEALLNHLRPPADARMLDVACGRGRHAKILASKGYDVTGIDLAPANIDYALRSAGDQLQFYQQDMRMPFWINYFDYAFNFFTSFGYFKTEREHVTAIRNISHSLRNRGVFVLDYLNAEWVQERLVPASEKKKGSVTFLLTRWSDKTHFYKSIRIRDTDLPEELEFIERVARFSLDDFEKMFQANSLIIQEVFGDYQLQAYEPKRSPRLILIAKKEG